MTGKWPPLGVGMRFPGSAPGNRRSATEVRHNGGASEAYPRLPDMAVKTG